MRSAFRTVLTLTSLMGGCIGQIGAAPDEKPTADVADEARGGAGGGPRTTPGDGTIDTGPKLPNTPMATPPTCGGQRAPVLRALLLSPSQYNNTVLDLLQVGGDFSKSFGGGVDGPPDELGVEYRAIAAAEVARAAVRTLAQWSPCDPVKTGEAACGKQLREQLGARAFRRPLSEAEKTQLGTLFSAGLKEKDFATGVEWLLTGILQAPDFLYRMSRPARAEKAGQILALDDYELASRLAFFLWDGAPDDGLLAAAAARELTDANRSAAHLERMLQDPRFTRGMQAFYTRWLGLHNFGEVARDSKTFTSEVVTSLRSSLLMSAMAVQAGPNANLDALFSGQSYPLNGPLRRFYSLPAGGEGFAPVEFPGRRGLLTHPALMTLLARPSATNPISRGIFIRRNLLCQEFDVPPGLDIPPLPAAKVDVSTRERLAAHSSNPTCAGCHAMIDPPGFALEGFDQVGKARTMDGGKPVDTSGMMTNAGELDGFFATGDDLLKRLPSSQMVRSCFARRYLEHALERAVSEDDRCASDGLQTAFAASGDLTALLPAIARSDSFRFRQTEGVAQ